MAWDPFAPPILAALSALAGIALAQSWTTEREAGKRRMDLAEEVLTLFYEARDAIAYIRIHFGHTAEGRTRTREEGETPEMTEARNRAYVFER
jgi:hypothetical protein